VSPTRWILAILILASSRAGADYRAYDGVKDLSASGGSTRAEHHHDWGRHTAYVRILDADTGRPLLERKSPALSTLWVSPDGLYVVGLSIIRSANPSQLFILGRDGAFVHEETVRCGDPRLRGLSCGESTSNFVWWYDEARPEIELVVRDGRPVELAVNAHHPRLCRGPKPEDTSDEEWKEICPATGDRLRLPLSE
jgi:hypothetical protein